jgi:galactokinase
VIFLAYLLEVIMVDYADRMKFVEKAIEVLQKCAKSFGYSAISKETMALLENEYNKKFNSKEKKTKKLKLME